MNNDASPILDPPPPGTDAEAVDADLRDHHLSPALHDRHDRHDRSASRSGRRRKKRSKKKRNPGLVKKLAFVTHLLKTLDLVVFAELSSLYYMECSILRFAVRGAAQYMYLTPKDESFPFLMPAGRLHVLLVAIPNMICMLLHLFASLPAGPDFHRGYQHGGLVIDFIGQKPPTSRLYYLLVDLVILATQCLMLTIHTQRENLRATLKTFRPLVPDNVPEVAPGRSSEDLDAEERGVSRHAPAAVVNEAEEIELQQFDRPDDGGGASDGVEESEAATPPDNSSDETSRTCLADLMSSGNAIIGEYHIIHSLKAAALARERTAAHTLQTISYRTTLAALQAQRRGANAQPQPERPSN